MSPGVGPGAPLSPFSLSAMPDLTVYQIDELMRRYGDACQRRRPQPEIMERLAAVRDEIERLKADAMSWRIQLRRLAAAEAEAAAAAPDPWGLAHSPEAEAGVQGGAGSSHERDDAN